MNVHFDEKAPRDTQVLVDTQAIRENFRNIREMCGETTAVMPVIKANAYGHGAAEIARVLYEEGAVYLAVATLTEALELRAASDDYPLFILGHTPDRLLDRVVENRITQTVLSLRLPPGSSLLKLSLLRNSIVHRNYGCLLRKMPPRR